MNEKDKIGAVIAHLDQTGTEEPSPSTITCYVPGTLIDTPKGDLINGQTITMCLIHPDGTPDNTRKWVRTRDSLAIWAATTDSLKAGTRIIAVGTPTPAPGKPREPGTARPWMVEASRITVDLTTENNPAQ